MNKKRLGLYIDEKGTMLKDGRPFYGAGVNYFDLFISAFSRNWDISINLKALETLKSYDCKIVRFCTLPFYVWDFKYFEQTENYWRTMDAIIKKAEELEIGLLPSFFWTFSVNDYFDEPMNSVMFQPESGTMRFIKDYTEKFVKRYAESPAIYGWEFSNERILFSDFDPARMDEAWKMPDGSKRGKNRTMDDVVTLDGLEASYKAFARFAASCDPHHRIISTGDTGPRNNQYQLWKDGALEMDTRAQHKIVIDKMNPAGITALSQHQYSNGTINPGDKTWQNLDYSETWEGLFCYLNQMAKERNIAAYAGEVGFMVANPDEYSLVTEKNIKDCVTASANAALKTKIPFILYWNYDPVTEPLDQNNLYDRGTGIEFSWNERMPRGKIMLEAMQHINKEADKCQK